MSNRVNATRLQPLLLKVAFASAVLAALALLLMWRAVGQQAQARESVAEFASLARSMPAQANAAAAGAADGFDALSASTAALEKLVQAGGKSGSLPGGQVWNSVLEQSQAVLDGRDAAVITREAATAAKQATPQLVAAAAGVMLALNPARDSSVAQAFERFKAAAERAPQSLGALADGSAAVDATLTQLTEDARLMKQLAGGLVGEDNPLGVTAAKGNAAEPAFFLKAAVDSYLEKISPVLRLGDPLMRLQAARNALQQSTAGIDVGIAKSGSLGLTGLLGTPWLPLGLISLAALALGGAMWLQREMASLRAAADLQAAQNERNQQAILRLLDELTSLADGDLTVQATVTEDITGAIADSINYAIEALRELVTTINDSAVKLDAATRQTQAISNHLAKASTAQSQQIGSASESITAMASSTEEVSGNAERAADVARHSVDIAHKGGDAVRRTIDGMNAIRENIQETSKRIKRLGESSQEIGNIVELINDMAEQTNILALNASIQASMAGEAGRGFAVVADEVQRLAERAANSTKQIEVLVRTIQADTNEAVTSMERTTTDVVGGALLAENAGAALEEIEQVSNQIASLVQNISASSRQQAGVSQSISRNMQVLREISAQTAESTAATSTSIGKLAELAAQLRQSVTGFRLPASARSGMTGEYPVIRPEDATAERPRRVG